MRKAVFLDRDGTINVEKDYLFRSEEFEFIPGVPEAIAQLNKAGYLVIVVTNQSGVARGYYIEEDVEQLHRHIDGELACAGAHVDAWIYCPHHPEGRGSYSLPCTCRKPLPGMLREATRRFDIDLSRSFMIGDKLLDIMAGQSAGCRTILVRTGYGMDQEHDIPPGCAVCDDLGMAVELILATAD